MPDELKCYPRTDAATGEERMVTLMQAQSLADARSMVSLDTAPFGSYYPLRRAQADGTSIAHLRNVLVGIAERHGFPRDSDAEGRAAFDREAAVALHAAMQILPVDAAQVDVWRWLHVWAVPDLLLWRFGKWEGVGAGWRVTADRVHNRAKGFLSRLWWRVELLGSELAPRIGEDEAVALVERTSAVGYRDFGRTLTREHLGFCEERGITNRGVFLRDVMKRVIRRKAVVEVAALTSEEATGFVRAILEESQRALGVGVAPEQRPDASKHHEKHGPERFEEHWAISAMSPASPARSESKAALKGSQGHALELAPYAEFRGTAVSLFLAEPGEVNKGVLGILSAEGPATGGRICRAYVTAAGMQHAGPQAMMDIQQSLEELTAFGAILVDPVKGQTWERTQYRLPEQPTVRAREAGPRRPDEVPLPEFLAVVDSVPHDPWAEPAQVLKEALSKFGLSVEDMDSAPWVPEALRQLRPVGLG